MKRKTHQRLRNRWVDIEERKDELFEVELAQSCADSELHDLGDAKQGN